MKTATKWTRWAAVAVLGLTMTAPAFATSKDMIQLQTQMQALQDAIARLQQSNDERMGVLKDLVQQTADSVNKMTLTVDSLKAQMDRQTELASGKNDALSGQIQGLNDSLDELRARMDKMQKMLGDVQGQQAQTNAILSSAPQGGAAQPAAAQPATPQTSAPQTVAPDTSSNAAPITRSDASTAAQPGSPIPMPDSSAASAPTAAPSGPSATELYRTAYSDYMAGKNSLAGSEFTSLVQAYPDNNLSGNAYFYLGEMDLRTNKPSSAIKNYDHTIEHFPGNQKIPAAQLHKAQALTQTGQKEAAARELRALIQRYPTSPEASQAKTRLTALSRR